MPDQTCVHELHEVKRYTPTKGKKDVAYVILVCAYCGHTRKVHEDGLIEASKIGGMVLYVDELVN